MHYPNQRDNPEFGHFHRCSSLTGLTIPNSVTSLGDSAFSSCSSLANLTIPDSITSIGRSTFSGCSSLTEVMIPNSVTAIGDSGFSQCSSLTGVTIPNSVTSIGRSAFAWCDNLTNVTISDSVTSIGAGAFSRCPSLTSITVGAGNTNYSSLGGVLFDFAQTRLIQYPVGDPSAHYSIPGSVTSIENAAFLGCSSLTGVTIPNSVTSIADFAFESCTNLTSVTIPDSVDSLGNSTFSGCTSLASLTISNSITSIGWSTFSRCLSLVDVTIPSSVTSIGDWAFDLCRSLTEVTIPNSVTSIGTGAFQWCSNMSEVTIAASVTSIGRWAFSGCSSLETVTIPSSVTSIGESVFGGCNSLTSISVEEGNTVYSSLDGVLFNLSQSQLIQFPIGRTSTHYSIPNAVTSIGAYAFYRSTRLTSVTIPDSVTSVGLRAFLECSSLATITLPHSVTSIEHGAFQSCTSLAAFAIPSSVTSIGSSAFRHCSSLSGVTIPSSVTSIGVVAFGDCASLTSFSVEEGNTNYRSIGGVLFNSSLSQLIQYPVGRTSTHYLIPNAVSSIGHSAFRQCSSLASVTIPSSVTSIGDYAFQHCTSLTTVTLPDSVTTIGQSAFEECPSLESVTIPTSSTSIDSWAFSSLFPMESSLLSFYFLAGAPPIQFRSFSDIHPDATAYVLQEHAASFGGDGANWHGLTVEVMDGRVATSLRSEGGVSYFLTSEPPILRLYVPGASGVAIEQATIRLNGVVSGLLDTPSRQTDAHGDYIEIVWPLIGSKVRRGAFDVEIEITDSTGQSSVSDSFTVYLEPRHLLDVVPVDSFVLGIEEIREAVEFVIANMRDDAVAWDRENVLNPELYVDELIKNSLRDYGKLAGGTIYQLSFITDLERSRVVQILNERFPGSIRVSGRESSLHTPASANYEPGDGWQDWAATHFTEGANATPGGGDLTRVRVYVVDNGVNWLHPELSDIQFWLDPNTSPPNTGTYWSPIFDNDPADPLPIASTQFYLDGHPGVLPPNWDRRHGTSTCAAIAGNTLGIRGRAAELGFGDVPFTIIPVNAYLDAAAGPADAIETTTDALAVSGAVWDIIEDVRRNPGPAVLALPLVTEYNQPNRTLECAVLAAVEAGIFVVAAAGNEGRSVGGYPDYLDAHCLDDSEGFELRVIEVDHLSELPDQGEAEIILGRVGPARILHVRVFGTMREQLADLTQTELQHPDLTIGNAPIDVINVRLEELEEFYALRNRVLAGAAQAAGLPATHVAGYRLDTYFGDSLPEREFSTVLLARTGFGAGDYTVRVFDQQGRLELDTALSASTDAQLIGDIESLGGRSAAETFRLENELLKSVVRAINDIAISRLQSGSRFPTGEGYSPARIPHIVTAGADDIGGVWDRSNVGDIDLYAPGATLRVAVTGTETYAGGSGTSFATAYIAGAAALLFSEHPELSPAAVTAILSETESAQGLPIDDEPALRLWPRGRPGMPSYASWLRRQGLTEVAYPEGADTDGDGINNRTEFHANLDPATPNDFAELVTFRPRHRTGSVGEFTFRRAPWAPPFSLCVASSCDLVNWSPISDSDGGGLPVRDSKGVYRKVDAAVDPSARARFFRFEWGR